MPKANSTIASQDTITQAKPRALKLGQMERTRNRVLKATSELLAEDGYQAVTMERIAQRSGVARSTIYRHWSSVAEVAMDAFHLQLGQQMQAPDTGNVRTDLIAVYHNFVNALQHTRWGRIIPAIVEAAIQDPAFATLLHQSTENWRELLVSILKKGVRRGDIPEVPSVEDLLDPIVGAIYYRFLFTQRELIHEGTLETWVNAAIDALITGQHSKPKS